MGTLRREPKARRRKWSRGGLDAAAENRGEQDAEAESCRQESHGGDGRGDRRGDGG